LEVERLMSVNRPAESRDEVLLREIRRITPRAVLPDLREIDQSQVSEKLYPQSSLHGCESHSPTRYLAIAFVRTMRDFTDAATGVYKSHDAVPAVVSLCSSERTLGRHLRKQIRGFLRAPGWQHDAVILDTWTCVHCGAVVADDGDGCTRRSHMEARHSDVLPLGRPKSLEGQRQRS